MLKTFAAAVASSMLAATSDALSPISFETNVNFNNFISTFNKQYPSLAEFQKRMDLYKKTDEFISAHNSQPDVSFTLGHNQFSDLTEDEKKAFFGYSAP